MGRQLIRKLYEVRVRHVASIPDVVPERMTTHYLSERDRKMLLPNYDLGYTQTMETVIPKKRLGRPATGRDPLVAFRLPEEFIARLDQLARDNDVTRSDLLRRLIEEGERALQRKRKRWARTETRNAAIVEAVIAGVHDEPEAPVIVNRRQGHGHRLTAEQIKAAADRAERRLKVTE